MCAPQSFSEVLEQVYAGYIHRVGKIFFHNLKNVMVNIKRSNGLKIHLQAELKLRKAPDST